MLFTRAVRSEVRSVRNESKCRSRQSHDFVIGVSVSGLRVRMIVSIAGGIARYRDRSFVLNASASRVVEIGAAVTVAVLFLVRVSRAQPRVSRRANCQSRHAARFAAR